MEIKTHWKKAFKSDYLSSADIDDKDVTLTIAKVEYKECVTASGKKFCNVATFKEQGIKPMILNVGNSKIVKKFAGNKQHLEEWLSIPIRVYVDQKVRFGNDTVEGLRIRETQPTAIRPVLKNDMAAWSKVYEAIKSKSKTIADIEKVYDLSEVKEELLKLC